MYGIFEGQMLMDPNMATALQWANEIGPYPPLPVSLHDDVVRRAKLVNAINDPLISSSLLCTLSEEEKNLRLKNIANLTTIYMPDVKDDMSRINIALHLWSGCLSAAKTIALETMAGPNTPEIRSLIFSKHIYPLTLEDPIFAAGVEAAPSFKKLLNQKYSFEGVPEDSVVRKYP